MRKIVYVLLLLLPLTSFAQRRGVIDVSVAHLREEPSYTAEMGTEELMGREVEIVGESGYWLQLITPDGYKAWTNRLCVKEMPEDRLRMYRASDKYICLSMYSTIYSGASEKSLPLSDLVRGDCLLISKGRAKNGFVRVSTPSGKEGWVRRKDVYPLDKWQSETVCSGENVVKEALLYVGIPYLWGGYSVKGFDCSGLVKMAFMMNGAGLPRNASQQAKLGEDIDISGVRDGDCSVLKKGDLIFFGDSDSGKVTHVGIYIGNSRMVHSSQVVRINSLRKTDGDCYENIDRLLCARRLYPQKD